MYPVPFLIGPIAHTQDALALMHMILLFIPFLPTANISKYYYMVAYV